MEIVLMVRVYSKDNKIDLNFTKTYNSVSVPAVGAKIKDDLFAESKEIIDVVFDYSRDKCFVTLVPREDTNERLAGHIQEVAAMHNWVLLEEATL